MMTQSVKSYTNIPAKVYEHYNTRYNNYTYRLFEAKLLKLIAHSPAYGGHAFAHTTLNLLIDASLERSGATFYAGAEVSLMQLIRPISADLVALARQHLENFAPSTRPERPQSETDYALYEILYAQESVELAVCRTSEVHSWRGRVAYAWVSAALSLLHAAAAVLVESHYDSYPLEKLDQAMNSLRSAALEGQAQHFAFAADFVTWMRQLVKARD
ncbi:MAG: hypothetical protein ABI947_19265 [Chloroflexota bacterium]